ncbi:hypothetical protein K438DRAFT_1833418 [Mycena galopus ATCC 62051]|nr:hypothetical protein K438DRAFT_1833418 [Mycena galopus ATCC 62051]
MPGFLPTLRRIVLVVAGNASDCCVGGEIYWMDTMVREEGELVEGNFDCVHRTRRRAGRAAASVSSNTIFIGSHAALVFFDATQLDCSTHILCVEPRTHAHWIGCVCCWQMDFCFHARTPSPRFIWSPPRGAHPEF